MKTKIFKLSTETFLSSGCKIKSELLARQQMKQVKVENLSNL